MFVGEVMQRGHERLHHRNMVSVCHHRQRGHRWMRRSLGRIGHRGDLFGADHLAGEGGAGQLGGDRLGRPGGGVALGQIISIVTSQSSCSHSAATYRGSCRRFSSSFVRWISTMIAWAGERRGPMMIRSRKVNRRGAGP
ncbi:hypothetical protein F5972_27055 [Microbispora cellulosiformans]|uniref:Uncharacterized protein n=1 Tax=Microbispora cellulosiformans TaxID=2614688 RepID=A0A5J5JVS5_9ACTN|nr:hypothetical protein [Microbispora cellulosiformans]KAA9375422.1 hypothetical protein F5972_27055 [Microbispora cellulosiformans]